MTDRAGDVSRVPQPPEHPAAEAAPQPADTGRRCARCNAAVRWRETKFCLDRRARFGGRVYCMGCQSTFPAVEA